ncbi:type II toxin-antitoxin system MqsA family antitoxin [Chelativorans sp. Marseille-P2723]|uniref:type II toxin-antitoxin system MqsA family antitoxin n=1 Tax=Chelativorans sp. Marseille-P2723 TaxID=2709133 RepID=UPI0015714E98|nr:type II toxin-antitoxin system MqsA family antitoxin [Chelativorans sp. Marseille-P2723]
MPEANGSSPQCGSCGGKLEDKLVDVTMWTGRGLVVIENVPAQVCQDCQEQFYEKDAAMKIQELVSQGFPSSRLVREIKVPIYSLKEGATPALPEDHGI